MTKVRKRKEKTDVQKQITLLRKQSPTHVVEIELDTSPGQRKHLGCVFEHGRIVRNTTLGEVYDRYEQMIRTKEYKRTLKSYIRISNQLNDTKVKAKIKILEQEKEVLQTKFVELRETHQVTFEFVRKTSEELQKRFNKANSIIGLVMAERVWLAMERLLFKDAKTVRFLKPKEFRSIQTKQNNRGIMLKQDKNGSFYVSFERQTYKLKTKKKDLFVQETLSGIANYLINGNQIDTENIQRLKEKQPLVSSYRVKYNRIVRKEIRGKVRYFLQIVLEGTPVVKRKKDGSFRHKLGKGRIGTDVGTQSVAHTTETKTILKNLAERTNKKRERKMVLLQRQQSRSLFTMNPANYNDNGTIKKGKKTWVFSKRYLERQKTLRNLHRIQADNRKYAHNQDINELRSLGDRGFVEAMSFKGLQKRAKETTVNEKTGKFNRKKRAGRSILNRSPGYYIKQAKYRFEFTGGSFEEVNTWTFKASQYDHKLNDENKKQLSQRWHVFQDGTKVQRDLYSSFLLFCSDEQKEKPHHELCQTHYEQFKRLHDECVEQIKNDRKVVCNSGITF